MKYIKSFSLSDDLVRIIDELPKNERSKRIEEILRKYLLEKDDIKLEHINDGLNKILEIIRDRDDFNFKDLNVEDNNIENQSAINALSSILSLREN